MQRSLVFLAVKSLARSTDVLFAIALTMIFVQIVFFFVSGQTNTVFMTIIVVSGVSAFVSLFTQSALEARLER